jgi:hypothetical protein
MNIFTGSDLLLVVAAIGASLTTVAGAFIPFWFRRRETSAGTDEETETVVRLSDDDRQLVDGLKALLHSIKTRLDSLVDEVIELRRVMRGREE